MPDTAGLIALAEAIAQAEGFGVDGAIPTVRHNPGDLEIDGLGTPTTFANDDDGWTALYAQLARIRDGRSAYYRPDMTLAQFAATWTATEQGAWLSNVIAGLRARGIVATAGTTVQEVLT